MSATNIEPRIVSNHLPRLYYSASAAVIDCRTSLETVGREFYATIETSHTYDIHVRGNNDGVTVTLVGADDEALDSMFFENIDEFDNFLSSKGFAYIDRSRFAEIFVYDNEGINVFIAA